MLIRVATVLPAIVGLFNLPAWAEEEPATQKPAPLRIVAVDIDEWKADKDDIHAVLYSAAHELWKFFPEQELPTIVVQPQGGPIVLFARGERGEIRVRLNTEGQLWAQYSYQFAHEFCHIVCRYDEDPHPNKWFEESLCEAASIFVMRQMAETWKVRPPYQNWRSYGKSLKSYADDVAAKNSLPDRVTFRQWFANHREQLNKRATDRDKNRIVALQLLPYLEKSPKSWQAVWYLNQAELTAEDGFKEYLTAWHNNAPLQHQPFIRDVALEFGIDLPE